MGGRERFQQAIDAIDAANAQDPTSISVRGRERPRELAQAELASEWVERLADSPSEALLLATRAHHLRRWTIPRRDYPEGRAGYRRWRRRLQLFHAEEVGTILEKAGYDQATIDRVGEIIRKERLDTDPEVQAFEDSLCLVFLETELVDTATKLDDDEKLIGVLRKTLRKMSSPAVALARDIPLDPDRRALLERARV
ncbi:MAG: DUF4202 domain-containing protein [Gaiellales bacterium]